MSRYPQIASSYLVITKDDKVLLLKRQNTGFCDGMYGLVAGHVEEEESVLDGLIREVKEESGLEINKDKINLAHIMHRKAAQDKRLDFFWITDEWIGEPSIMEPEKCSELDWFPLDDLPDNTINYIREALEFIRQQQIYSEFGW